MNAILKAHSGAWLDSKIYRLAWLVGPLVVAMFVFGSRFWITASNNFRLLPLPISYTEDEKKKIDADLKANEAVALQALRAAAEDGDPRALNQLGILHDPTISRLSSVPPNLDMALAYFEKASALGSVNALLNAGVMLSASGKTDQSCIYMVKAYKAAPTNIEAMAESGYCTATEKDVGATEKAKSIEQLETSGASGYARAYALLGTVYLFQNPPDFRQALSSFEKAIAAKISDEGYSHYKIASIYFLGQTGVPQDLRKAREHFLKGFEQGSADSAIDLSFIYSTGSYGVPISYGKAFEYANFAAQRGRAEGHGNLHFLYVNGFGTQRNYDMAAMHFLNAISLGSKEKLDNFKSLNPGSAEYISVLQNRLKKAVLYSGPIDGKVNPLMIRSVESLFNSKRSFE